MRYASLVALVVCAAAFSGCTELNTTVTLDGSLVAGECGELLPWSLPFATWTDTGEADAVLRLQSVPGSSSSAKDTIVFVIDQKASLYDALGVPIEVGDREFAGAQASGFITLPVRCPQQKSLSIQLFGDLTFETLPQKSGKPIVGHFVGEAIDTRNQEILSTDLTIQFDFPRKFQTPWQTYPTPRP